MTTPPAWLQPLVDAVRGVRATDLMPRVGEPDANVRRSAVLALFGETEVHGPDVPIPEGATVYFAGVDDHLGPLTKYAQVHRDGLS